MKKNLLVALTLMAASIDARLLVSIDPSASFSPEEFAQSLGGTLLHIEPRNPYKAIHQVFVDEDFLVLSQAVDHENQTIFDDVQLRMLGYTYGYRCLYFQNESLQEAMRISLEMMEKTPQFASEIEPLLPEESEHLYQLAEKIDRVLSEHEIHYWAGRETLLGAVQYGGLRPWDDYLHFFTFDFEEGKLTALKEEFAAVGLELHYYWKDFYKIYDQNGKVLEDKYHPGQILPFKYPAANIFIMSLEKRNEAADVYVHRSENFYKYWNFDRFDYFQIQNLQRVPFGPITLPAPQNPELYFNRVFGRPHYEDLWEKYAFERLFDHRNEYKPTYPGAALVEIDNFFPASWKEKI